jgi:hypothetical protein
MDSPIKNFLVRLIVIGKMTIPIQNFNTFSHFVHVKLAQAAGQPSGQDSEVAPTHHPCV